MNDDVNAAMATSRKIRTATFSHFKTASDATDYAGMDDAGNETWTSVRFFTVAASQNVTYGVAFMATRAALNNATNIK
jgi:hypothetical protein